GLAAKAITFILPPISVPLEYNKYIGITQC
ncbi:unnamed protein product, partial [marine sediment metagenome]